MGNRFGLIFVVLVLCGTFSVVGALAILALLFNSHAAPMSVANEYGAPVYVLTFLFFVVVPAVITILAGIWMIATGIRIGQKASGEPPVK